MFRTEHHRINLPCKELYILSFIRSSTYKKKSRHSLRKQTTPRYIIIELNWCIIPLAHIYVYIGHAAISIHYIYLYL